MKNSRIIAVIMAAVMTLFSLSAAVFARELTPEEEEWKRTLEQVYGEGYFDDYTGGFSSSQEDIDALAEYILKKWYQEKYGDDWEKYYNADMEDAQRIEDEEREAYIRSVTSEVFEPPVCERKRFSATDNYIKGLSEFIYLEELDLSNCDCNEVTDWTPLTKLENLKILRLGKTGGETDFSWLSGMKSLKVLQLYELEGEKNIKTLSGLTNLKEFTCQFISGLKSLKPFEKMTGLEKLDISAGVGHSEDWELKDISSLTKLKKLRSLGLGRFTGLDLKLIGKLTNLEELCLRSNWDLSDLSPLRSLKNITSLQLYDIPDKKNTALVISSMKKLKNLSLCCVDQETVNVIGKLASLKTLSIDNYHYNPGFKAHAADLSPLGELTALTELTINSGADMSFLSSLKKLTKLTMRGDFKNLKPAAKLTKLKELYADSDKLSDISALSKLKNLTTLTIYSEKLSKITVLSKLKKVTSLTLGSPKLRDFSPVSKMTKLVSVAVNGCYVEDFTPFYKLKNLRYFHYGQGDKELLHEISSNMPECHVHMTSFG